MAGGTRPIAQAGEKIARDKREGMVKFIATGDPMGIVTYLMNSLPIPDAGLVLSLENAVQQGDVTINELLVSRKVFRKSPTLVASINAAVRRVRKKGNKR